jgi:nucleotide-binding universal stress UspA family protein
MKTLLYATDCSKSSSLALKYAYNLSLILNADLHVLHVFDLLPIISASVRSREAAIHNFREEQQNLLQAYCLEHLQEEFGQPHIHYHACRNDSIARAILETANKVAADLVMIGAPGSDSMRGVFSENIGDDLISRIKTKLLVIPEYPVFHGISNFVYATDFDEADIIGLKELVDMARPMGAHIHVIHIPRAKETHADRKMYWFRRMVSSYVAYPEITYQMERAEDVETGIHRSIEQMAPEILVMMERPKTSFWAKLFHRDMVKTMGHEISIGLMVFNKDLILAEQPALRAKEAV